ncbi:MAG: class II aldolase/adducin family protein, partial [Fimbriimonadaceae bacterium]|nr:class II aldolase/adducin family protein [Fimbriimonadaceae bacterium]
GFSLAEAGADSFVPVRLSGLVAAVRSEDRLSDEEVTRTLTRAVADDRGLRPSVESFMHADLLDLPGVNWVAHSHPEPLLSLLGLRRARELAKLRLFPDEIVCCGPQSAFVPYVDPGLMLARAIRTSVAAYVEVWGEWPKTIWMQNHGLISLGGTADEALAGTRMAIKAARAWLGMLQTGEEFTPLSIQDVNRIHRRPDEHYRQELLRRLRG